MREWIEIFNFSIFGYGLNLQYFNLSHSLSNSDGSLRKYEFEFDKGYKYRNPSIIIGWSYLKGLKLTIKININ